MPSKVSIAIVVMAVVVLCSHPVSASEDLGFFYDDMLQRIIHQPYTLTFDKGTFELPLDQYIHEFATLVPRKDYHSEIENPYYCHERTSQLSLCMVTQPATGHPYFKKAARLTLDDGKLKKYLGEIASRVDSASENGKLTIGEDGKVSVFTQSKPGVRLNVDRSYSNIVAAIREEAPSTTPLPLSVETIPPDVPTQDIEKLGLTEIIGHGESNFRGSPVNRVFNINVALDRFKGYLIKPGEEFSFTAILGPVEEYTGYRKELVIKKNETVPEFGGGVCQVSTTMFRAALNAGLKITERHNHAYPVQYYAPQGTDATVYVPKPDLRFLNDTPGYILIQPKITGTILSFDLYGTSDGRKVEMVGPKVIERTPEGGLKTTYKRILSDKDGNLIREDVFNSTYDNPDKYHNDKIITEKPSDWSKKQWSDYKKAHGM